MKAGFSSLVITPELDNRKKPLRLGGFLPRKYCTGVHDDLFIRGIYLEGNESDQSTHVLMLVGDVIAIDKKLAKIVKKIISKRIPIKPENIMISATHTHHGPDYKGTFLVGGALAIIRGFFFPNPQTGELIRFGRKIIKCAIKAYEDRENVHVGQNQDFIPESNRIMINRRAPFDSDKAKYPVSVITFCHAKGKLNGQIKGAIINYAVHGTVLPRYNTLITADYVGYLIKHLESQYPESRGNFLYFNGPCGEINPLTQELAKKMEKAGKLENLTNDDIYDQIGTWDDAKRIGETIADTAIKIIKHTKCTSDNQIDKISVHNRTLKIPLKEYNYGTSISATFQRLLFKIKKKAFLLFAKIGLLKSSILLSADALSHKVIEAFIQVIDLGGTIIYTVPAEFFLKLANEILDYSNRKFPKKQPYMIELANDSIGYMYTVEAFVEGGYESEFSLTPLGGRYLTMKIKQFIDELS